MKLQDRIEEQRQTPAPNAKSSAHSLEDAVNSRNSLQGYAAMNEVDQHSEIAEEAANENSDEHEEIARLAYQYHLERGAEHGSDEEDWYRAEKVVRGRRSQGPNQSSSAGRSGS